MPTVPAYWGRALEHATSRLTGQRHGMRWRQRTMTESPFHDLSTFTSHLHFTVRTPFRSFSSEAPNRLQPLVNLVVFLKLKYCTYKILESLNPTTSTLPFFVTLAKTRNNYLDLLLFLLQ